MHEFCPFRHPICLRNVVLSQHVRKYVHTYTCVCISVCLHLGHTFCSECCILLFQSVNPICPEPHCTSTGKITMDAIKKPSDLLISSLAFLLYKCSNGRCNTTLPLQNLVVQSTQCTGNPLHMSCTPSRIPLRDILDATVDKTPSTIERRAIGHLTKRMMMSSREYSTHSTIKVPTGGQVCFHTGSQILSWKKRLIVSNSEIAT